MLPGKLKTFFLKTTFYSGPWPRVKCVWTDSPPSPAVTPCRRRMSLCAMTKLNSDPSTCSSGVDVSLGVPPLSMTALWQ